MSWDTAEAIVAAPIGSCATFTAAPTVTFTKTADSTWVEDDMPSYANPKYWTRREYSDHRIFLFGVIITHTPATVNA